MEPNNAIYDARQLGTPRMMILGVQHLFAMFGATVLVPLITGLDVSVTLLFAGIGTLMFHFISKWNVPAFLGSSFAFLGGYASVKEMGMSQGLSETLALDYACLGVACAGLMYFIMAALIKFFGVQKILHYFPPVVTGPIVIAIGLVLSGSAIANCQTNWLLAIIAIITVITVAESCDEHNEQHCQQKTNDKIQKDNDFGLFGCSGRPAYIFTSGHFYSPCVLSVCEDSSSIAPASAGISLLSVISISSGAVSSISERLIPAFCVSFSSIALSRRITRLLSLRLLKESVSSLVSPRYFCTRTARSASISATAASVFSISSVQE